MTGESLAAGLGGGPARRPSPQGPRRRAAAPCIVSQTARKYIIGPADAPKRSQEPALLTASKIVAPVPYLASWTCGSKWGVGTLLTAHTTVTCTDSSCSPAAMAMAASLAAGAARASKRY